MINLAPKNKLIKTMSVVSLLCLVVYIAGLILVINKINEIKTIYKDTESDVVKKGRLIILRQVADNNTDYLSKMRGYFIPKEDEIGFIESIEDVGKKTGVNIVISSILKDKKETETVFKENMVLSLNISGSWQGVINTIDSLEKMPFGVVIDELKIDSSEQDNWSGSLKVIVYKEK